VIHRALIVGLGKIGWRGWPQQPTVETHYAQLSQHPSIEVVGGVDTDDATRAEFQGVTTKLVYSDLQTALADCSPSIVVVATPPSNHRASVIAAAHGASVRGIICEKPMAATVDECSEMAVTCYRKDKVLLIGHQRRYEQSHRLLRAFLKSEVLGPVVGGRCVFPGEEWLNNGSHAADTMRMLVGDALPYSLRKGAPNTRVFQAIVACRYGNVMLESYGHLVPGYLRAMYDDLIECMETGKQPECSAQDGLEAVRATLAAEEVWRETAA
jgi:predicted dehydrogenase